jgi:hypothetical protein
MAVRRTVNRIARSRCQAVSLGWLLFGVVPVIRDGWGVSLRSPPRRCSAAITTGFASRVVDFPSPVCSPHLIPDAGIGPSVRKSIETGLGTSSGRLEGGSGQIPHPRFVPTWGTLGPVDRQNPITPGNWPHAGLSSHSLLRGRHRGLRPKRASGELASWFVRPLFGFPRFGTRVGLEAGWIPGTALLVDALPGACSFELQLHESGL